MEDELELDRLTPSPFVIGDDAQINDAERGRAHAGRFRRDRRVLHLDVVDCEHPVPHHEPLVGLVSLECARRR